MTPPMREKKKIDSLPPPPKFREGGHHRKGDGILCYAQKAWSKGPSRNFDIPVWYSGQFGIPARLLRKPSKDSTSKEKALCLIVRMNYMLDYPYRFGMDSRLHFFCLPARRARVACRSLGPLYERDEAGGFTPRFAMNTSFASSNNYDWKRALACTLRNFVHFVGVYNTDVSTWWNSALL